MAYVDGFVIPVLKKNIPAYLKIAKMASKLWKEHGALEYYEAVGDDMEIKLPEGMPASKAPIGFPKMAKAKPEETVVFAWIVYKNRAHRDKVNAKVMGDPRMAKMAEMMNLEGKPVFDCKRMACGGFEIKVKG